MRFILGMGIGTIWVLFVGIVRRMSLLKTRRGSRENRAIVDILARALMGAEAYPGYKAKKVILALESAGYRIVKISKSRKKEESDAV